MNILIYLAEYIKLHFDQSFDMSYHYIIMKGTILYFIKTKVSFKIHKMQQPVNQINCITEVSLALEAKESEFEGRVLIYPPCVENILENILPLRTSNFLSVISKLYFCVGYQWI